MAFLDKFTRATNSQNFIPEIDGFRFFAIITVVLMHLNVGFCRTAGLNYKDGMMVICSLSWFLNRGGLGVQVFFSISGFILSMPFLKYYLQRNNTILGNHLIPKPKLGSYYLRRLTRLEPPFIIAITFFFIVHVVLKEVPIKELTQHFIATLTYLHCIIYNAWSTINPVTWSLETEIQFYLLAPFICKWIFQKSRNPASIIAVLSVITLLGAYYFKDTYHDLHLSFSLLQQLPFFLVGILVAYIYLTNKSFLEKKSVLFDVIGLGSMFLLFYFSFGYFISDVGFILFLFLLFISVFKGRFMNMVFTNKLIYVIGGMCYTIYLLHYPFFYLICNYTKPLIIFDSYALNFWIQAFVILPLLLVVCGLFYYFIEKPCMDKNWPKKLWMKISGSRCKNN
ncbi:MAG: acyltransferase [Bacteroidales bacterium]|nr:acyltransferase [Bacteroidales bacterium]MDD4669823.1 acyltransferase [Bacteroidales bacterium]